MYHHIENPPNDAGRHECLYVPRRIFERQMDQLLESGWSTVTGREYEQTLASPSRKRLWITFDDGWRNNHPAAMEVLHARGMKATFFLVANWVDGSRSDCLDPGLIREMVAAGMEFGAHTLTHPRLARLDPVQMAMEVCDSRKRLEDLTQAPIDFFCYPYGNHNQAVVDAVVSSGYRMALSTIRGSRNSESDRWRLKRVIITRHHLGMKMSYSLSTLYHLLHQWKNLKRWRDS